MNFKIEIITKPFAGCNASCIKNKKKTTNYLEFPYELFSDFCACQVFMIAWIVQIKTYPYIRTIYT